MANPEHVEMLKKGVERWNAWREENPEVVPDLSDLRDLRALGFGSPYLAGANFRGANLERVDLQAYKHWDPSLDRADLRGAHLWRAYLRGAFLREANLREAGLSEAILIEANLSGAILFNANLFAANLSWANLAKANFARSNLLFANLQSAELSEANFSLAGAGSTNFANVDLSTAKGLEIVQHVGPSTVGIDTIYKSQGKIPEVFLRGCGVPEEFIRYIGSMVGRPLEFYSCFISYSTKDQEFADRLYADLQNKGVRCWFAPHDIKAGEKIHEQVDDAIRMHDKLLLILSEDSMNSEWVKTEIAKARKRELKEKRKMLFPVSLVPYDPVVKDWECFDADTGKDSAREIREYYIPDFSSWKDHDSYQKAFQRLVGDLKAETKSAAG